MSNYDGSMKNSKVPMLNASFQFRFYDLPMDGMNARVVRKIATTLRRIQNVDLNELRPRWSEFIEVQILLDISYPLPRGKCVALRDSNYVWVHFNYEYLPSFVIIVAFLIMEIVAAYCGVTTKNNLILIDFLMVDGCGQGGTPMQNQTRFVQRTIWLRNLFMLLTQIVIGVCR